MRGSACWPFLPHGDVGRTGRGQRLSRPGCPALAERHVGVSGHEIEFGGASTCEWVPEITRQMALPWLRYSESMGRGLVFECYYLDCLSQASYLVGDATSGRAVVVDPRRDVAVYVDEAQSAGLAIELIVETHFHADFLSGHLELAALTGAEVGISSVAFPEFDFRPLTDGERLTLGEVVLEFRHTPGHTPESLSVVVWGHGDDPEPYGVLTGDTLFVGGVGRPDLLATAGMSEEKMAGDLYDSLHQRLMVLPDATRVFPAHGAGSACGKNLSVERSSTIGEQRRTNYAVAAVDRAEFIDLVTEGQPVVPAYFAYDAALNKAERSLLDEEALPTAMGLEEVNAALSSGAVVIDVRDPESFASGHLVGALNVGLEGRFAEAAGSVVPFEVDLVLVAEEGAALEAKNRLARIGLDRVVGYLEDAHRVMAENPRITMGSFRLTAQTLRERIGELHDIQLLDVRTAGEISSGTIEGSIHIPMGSITDRIDQLDPSRSTVVFCAGGYRSSIVASLLRKAGFDDVSDLVGGYGSWY